jgi:phenylalanine-4-hydroxylase
MKRLKIAKGIIRIRKSKKNRQWSKEKVQMDKQRSTKHTYKTKYWATRIPLKLGKSTCICYEFLNKINNLDLQRKATKEFKKNTINLLTLYNIYKSKSSVYW